MFPRRQTPWPGLGASEGQCARIPGVWPVTVLARPLHSLCPGKLEKHTGRNAMQEGTRGRVRVKVPSAATANELWLQMPPLHGPGFWAQEGRCAASTTAYLTCTPHTSGLRPPGLPKLLESEKRGQAPTVVHNLHPDPSVFSPSCARLSGRKSSPRRSPAV